MYHVNVRSCYALTSVALFMLSSVTPCASHTAFTTNQNWSRSLFPTPLNTDNFIALAILNCGGGEGRVGEDGGDDGEIGGGVGGGRMCRFSSLSDLSHFLAKLSQALPRLLVELRSRD